MTTANIARSGEVIEETAIDVLADYYPPKQAPLTQRKSSLFHQIEQHRSHLAFDGSCGDGGQPPSTTKLSQVAERTKGKHPSWFYTHKETQIQNQRRSCLHFIEVIVFMVGFLVLMWTHEDIERVYELEHVMKIEMSKQYGPHSLTFADVKDVKELWEWLDGSLMPVLVHHKDAIGHFLPKQEWGYLADYNRVIGGLRIYQHRSNEEHCHYSKLHEFYGECHPFRTTNHASFGYPDCNDKATVARYHEVHADDLFDDDKYSHACFNSTKYEGAVDFHNDEAFSYDHESKTFEMWIDLFDEEEIINRRIDYIKDRHWIDRQTKSVTFELLVFNGQYEPLICHILLSFYVSRVGYVTPSVQIETAPLSPYFTQMYSKVALEILFVLVLAHLAFTEFKEIRERKIRRKVIAVWTGVNDEQVTSSTWAQALWEHFYSGEDPLSNIIDVATVGLGLGICVEWYLLTQHMADAERALQHLHRPDDLVQYDDTDHDVRSEYHHQVEHVEHLVDVVMKDMALLRRLSFFMVTLMIFLMFKTWDGIPAMQGVSATITIAAARLSSFLLICICLLTLFAGGAMLSFGHYMSEFNTIMNSFVTTLIVISTATEGIYEKQLEIDPFLASTWHWLLMCIMYVVCLNLVLCILVDAYGEIQARRKEKEDAEHHLPTLYEQSVDTAQYCYSTVVDSLRNTAKQVLRKKPSVKPELAIANVTTLLMEQQQNARAQCEPAVGARSSSIGDDSLTSEPIELIGLNLGEPGEA